MTNSSLSLPVGSSTHTHAQLKSSNTLTHAHKVNTHYVIYSPSVFIITKRLHDIDFINLRCGSALCGRMNQNLRESLFCSLNFVPLDLVSRCVYSSRFTVSVCEITAGKVWRKLNSCISRLTVTLPGNKSRYFLFFFDGFLRTENGDKSNLI